MYVNAAIALELNAQDPVRMFAKARELANPETISVVHIVQLGETSTCSSPLGFEIGLIEQEYWACDAHLKRCAKREGIPEERCTLAIGNIALRLSEYVSRNRCDLLILGATSKSSDSITYGQLAANALLVCDCDILVMSPNFPTMDASWQ